MSLVFLLEISHLLRARNAKEECYIDLFIQLRGGEIETI